MHVKVNYKNISNLVTYDELLKTLPKVEEAHKTLVNKSGAGNDFLGWVDWPLNYDKEEYDKIKEDYDEFVEYIDEYTTLLAPSTTVGFSP